LEQDVEQDGTTEEECGYRGLEKVFNHLHHGLDYTGIPPIGNQ